MLRAALRGLLAIAALLLALAVPASAQTAGTITGRVVDGQGAVVPGVTITVAGPTLQGTRTTVSQADGRFTVLGLPPGTYEVVAELQGFNTSGNPTSSCGSTRRSRSRSRSTWRSWPRWSPCRPTGSRRSSTR